MKQIKPSVATVQRKGEELIDSCGAQGNVPVTLEQTFTSFNERWENVGKMLQDRKQQIHLLQKRREVQELCNRLEGVLVDAEKVVERFGDIPEIEYEMKSQLEQCKVEEKKPLCRLLKQRLNHNPGLCFVQRCCLQ